MDEPASPKQSTSAETKPRSKKRSAEASTKEKRRCVSTACIACRRRKSKCDGNLPSCAACASVYGTECIYDPGSDHRRKGVYKRDIDNLKTKNSTLQTLIHGILNYPESEVLDLVKQIRSCENLEEVAEAILTRDAEPDEPIHDILGPESASSLPSLEKEMSVKMGELKMEDGSVRYIGGTSNLLFIDSNFDDSASDMTYDSLGDVDDPVTSWTTVTKDPDFVVHLVNMYFTWHYPYFTTLAKNLFYQDFLLGAAQIESRKTTVYCTPLLVNAILALGCHFTSAPAARDNPDDAKTAGDHFFREAKRLIKDDDEHERPRLATVQALALMSVREAGCGREATGWVYSGMSFRMALDIGLNFGSVMGETNGLDEQEIDARRITMWGCFLFDKCWSNYLGRLPQLPQSLITCPKFDVFPDEDSDTWSPYTDEGIKMLHAQPGRTRAVGLQILSLCEISSDIISFFYNPINMEKGTTKSNEVKKLSEFHTRLEAWSKELPKELEARDGALPTVLLMHMFYHLLYIHLFRPFFKYSSTTSPLPSTVSPRRVCTQAATHISRIVRIYKRSYGLRQICNIAIYIIHSACAIHILNMPEKNAARDILYGFKHLEEMAEAWLCASRSIDALATLATKWKRDLPQEVLAVLAKNDVLYGSFWHDRKDSKHKGRRSSRGDPSASPAGSGVNHTSSSSEKMVSDIQERNHPQTITGSGFPAPFPNYSTQLSTSQTAPRNTMTTSEQSPSDSSGWWIRDQVPMENGLDNWNGIDFDAAVSAAELQAAGGFNSFPIMSAQDSAFIASLMKSGSSENRAPSFQNTGGSSGGEWFHNQQPFQPPRQPQ